MQETETDAAEREEDALKQVAIAKMNYTKQWGLAFLLFADEHGGRIPTSFEEAAPFFGREVALTDSPPTVLDARSSSFIVAMPTAGGSNVTVINPSQYEIMFQGRLDQVTEPAKTILIREREPFASLSRPGLARTYLFADGHSEVHLAPDGDFTAWEQERLAHPAQ